MLMRITQHNKTVRKANKTIDNEREWFKELEGQYSELETKNKALQIQLKESQEKGGKVWKLVYNASWRAWNISRGDVSQDKIIDVVSEIHSALEHALAALGDKT